MVVTTRERRSPSGAALFGMASSAGPRSSSRTCTTRRSVPVCFGLIAGRREGNVVSARIATRRACPVWCGWAPLRDPRRRGLHCGPGHLTAGRRCGLSSSAWRAPARCPEPQHRGNGAGAHWHDRRRPRPVHRRRRDPGAVADSTTRSTGPEPFALWTLTYAGSWPRSPSSSWPAGCRQCDPTWAEDEPVATVA